MPVPESGFPKNSAPDDSFQGAVVSTVSKEAVLAGVYLKLIFQKFRTANIK